jgi:GNAT superfamily N-acetyltransferase
LIKRVRCADWLLAEDAQPLIAEYAKECSIPAIGPISPQPYMYAAMESAGVMQSFAAYLGGSGGHSAPGLVGFANVLTPVLPHYGLKVATVETLFVNQQGRKSGAGRELMLALERYAHEQGCVGILYSAPAGGQLERVLSAKKYQRTNSVFYRPLS